MAGFRPHLVSCSLSQRDLAGSASARTDSQWRSSNGSLRNANRRWLEFDMDKSPLLTIGMATYDDYEGVWSTIQALKLYHDLSRVKLLVVNNNPDSPAGQKIERYCHKAGAFH